MYDTFNRSLFYFASKSKSIEILQFITQYLKRDMDNPKTHVFFLFGKNHIIPMQVKKMLMARR